MGRSHRPPHGQRLSTIRIVARATTDHGETETLIQPDRRLVVRPDLEKADLGTSPLGLGEAGLEEAGRQAPAAMLERHSHPQELGFERCQPNRQIAG